MASTGFATPARCSWTTSRPVKCRPVRAVAVEHGARVETVRRAARVPLAKVDAARGAAADELVGTDPVPVAPNKARTAHVWREQLQQADLAQTAPASRARAARTASLPRQTASAACSRAAPTSARRSRARPRRRHDHQPRCLWPRSENSFIERAMRSLHIFNVTSIYRQLIFFRKFSRWRQKKSFCLYDPHRLAPLACCSMPRAPAAKILIAHVALLYWEWDF